MSLWSRLRARLLSRRPPAVVRLPSLHGPGRGTVVLSYVNDCFAADPLRHYHTNRWECQTMARTWQEAGFDVAAVNCSDNAYQPPANAAVIIDIHHQLERFASCAPRARRILHATGAHWATQNAAEESRLAALFARRKITLPVRRHSPPTRAEEVAQVISILGGPFAQESYRRFGKPLHPLPLPCGFAAPWPVARPPSAQRRFLWLGSHGFVHKGLDLALEAFACRPELSLTVCGPLESEPDFCAAFAAELHRPNIRAIGWVDTHAPDFAALLAEHGALIYPSCSEGVSGAAVTAVHGGLLPVVTPAAGLDVAPFGGVIAEGSVAAVGQAVDAVAALPAAEFAARAHAGWQWVRNTHTRAAYAAAYATFVDTQAALVPAA